ncbi:MAG: hypothetical protein NXI31_16575 [bacterium]|nr:hypothetical protein [bacterium]
MTKPDNVDVIADSPAAASSPAARFVRALALVCGAVTLAGLGVHDHFFAVDPATAARAAVLRSTAGLAAERAAELDPDWLDESPPPTPHYPTPPAMLEAWARIPQLMFLCEINESLLRALWQKGTGLTHLLGPDAPRAFDVFRTPDDAPFPRFRYPRSTTMPDGLTTNAFGFRGPEITLAKPQNTVRIAFVGASATVDNHYFPASFPEYVGHWLNLWAERRGITTRFEIINAGREAITSQDIRAIVQHEVLPFAVDYVVYYEGQNQFASQTLERLVEVEGAAAGEQPPADLVLDLATADRLQPHWLDRACRDSTSARRLRRLLGIYANVPEPEKPPQQIRLPAGIDENVPDLANANRLLELGTILADLDGIRTACERADAQLVMCSFDRLVHAGLAADLATGLSFYSQVHTDYWPLTYEIIARLDALQNRYFEAWAKARNLPFVDVAELMPDEPVLFSDMIHSTALGSRLRAWVIFSQLVPLIAGDLERGAVPVTDSERQPGDTHPNLQPARRITAEELDR